MVYVFKTNIKSTTQVENIKSHIDNNFPNTKWNFDLEDCDNIFRIESELNILEKIYNTFISLGYNCEELPD